MVISLNLLLILSIIMIAIHCDYDDYEDVHDDADDDGDATDTSDPSETQVVADPVPLTFELCTETNPGEGACVCATEPGFQTYRAAQGDTERCFTVYSCSMNKL